MTKTNNQRHLIKALTWNILAPLWFDEYQNITYGLNISNKKKFHEMRLQNIINSIKIIEPDIICLQEITREWLKVIKKELKYKTYYSIFHQHLSMFSRKHLNNLLIQSGLQIDKLLNENGIIFCSVKKHFGKFVYVFLKLK